MNLDFLDKIEREEENDAAGLPEWAQKHRAVCWLAARNLAFRCDVFSMETTQMQAVLIDKANKLYYGEE